MIRYFRQAWNLIRQEKLFSSIYIVGTGLSIAVVMALSIVFYVKIGNVYPENNRDRMLTVRYAAEYRKDGGMHGSSLGYRTLETCFKSLESAEVVAAILTTYDENYVQPDGCREQLPVAVKYVDTEFWMVFTFRFVAGKPFSEADMESGIRTAVIAEGLANRLFGSAAEAVGQEVSLNHRRFRVSGVVKDVSGVTECTYAQLWIPYSVFPDYKEKSWGQQKTLGPYSAYILAPSRSQMDAVRQEALDNIRRLDQGIEEADIDMFGQPDRQWQAILRPGTMRELRFSSELLRYGLIFAALLLIPAVSLSGMTESRMERRLSEMGIRRAFGARRSTLLGQVLAENFLFTLLGGAVGLVLSYLFILANNGWILKLGGNTFMFSHLGSETVFTPAMLINGPVFLIALAVCFLLNLLSALIPAWRASRREIIQSLTSKSLK